MQDHMIDTKKLAVAIRARRGRLTLREAARECGIALGTMSSLENEGRPDLDNFAKVCDWIGMPMDDFRVEREAA